MITEQKRTRRHEATRQRILEAALALAGEEGWSSVTMRKIADRIDYSHPALYAYFATKEALLMALLLEGLGLYRDALEAARLGADSPEEAVVAIGTALWDFAWEHPELYQVMHGLGGVAFASADTTDAGRRAGEPAFTAIAALLAERGLDPSTAERKATLYWSTIHGLVSLTMAGRFSREEGASLARDATRDTLVAWGVAPGPAPR